MRGAARGRGARSAAQRNAARGRGGEEPAQRAPPRARGLPRAHRRRPPAKDAHLIKTQGAAVFEIDIEILWRVLNKP